MMHDVIQPNHRRSFLKKGVAGSLGLAGIFSQMSAVEASIGNNAPLTPKEDLKITRLGEGYLKEPFIIKEGFVEIPKNPGLGIEPDEHQLADKIRPILAKSVNL